MCMYVHIIVGNGNKVESSDPINYLYNEVRSA